MSLGQALAGALPRLRAAAESMMIDACTITRPGTPVFNANTGEYTTPSTDIYAGKCRIRTRSTIFLRDKEVKAGEAEVVIWPYIVAVPMSVTGIQVLDVVTVTASQDPALVGVVMRVRITNLATDSTARRMDCEEIANA